MKKMVCYLLLMVVPCGHASSSKAWDQHVKEVTDLCVKASHLLQAKPTTKVILFDDSVGYDALLIVGKQGKELCLFDKNTRIAHVEEVVQIK